MIQFGMPTLIENRSLSDNIALCKRLGLRFIELNMNFPEYQLDKFDRSFYEAADKAGIYYTIHLDENLNIADFNPLVADAYLKTVKRAIKTARTWLPLRNSHGVKNQPLIINIHMNHGIYITLPGQKTAMYDRNFDVYMGSFIKFRALCEEWIGRDDVVVSIENTDGFRGYEKTAIEYLLESPKFALTWDIGHSKAIGETDVPFMMEHKDKLEHFHIHDGTAESDGRPGRSHLALGDGEINLRERLSLAEALNARCVLETKTIAALEKSVGYLRSLARDENRGKFL